MKRDPVGFLKEDMTSLRKDNLEHCEWKRGIDA